MDWLKPSLLVIAFIGGLVGECYGRSNSNFEVVQRYEQCVLNRLYRAHFFAEEDTVRMIKIVNETNQRMHLLHLDPRNASDARTMLRLFAAALANLVADNDVPMNPRRKDAYVTVIKTCSSPLPQQIAEELLHEVEQIFVSMETAKPAGTSGNEMSVLSSESSRSLTPDVHVRRQRLKRSPQGEAFSTFGGWQPTESLQTVLSNILMNSNVFLNVFRSGISRRDALYYARNMIESGLANYHFSVIQEAVNAVSNAVSSFSFRPVAFDYAFAITNSIASVLDARQLSFFADGVGIGNGLVSRLQRMLDNKNPSVSFSTNSGGGSSGFSWATSSGSTPTQQRRVSNSQVNSGNGGSKQSSTVFSLQRDSEQFKNDLAFFLYQSNKIQGAFCNGPFQGIFEMVNEGLSEYTLPISTTAATIVTDSLTSMGSDLACAQFGNVIAETVTNILSENNLLQSANAERIADKMASNIFPRRDFKEPARQNQKDSSSQAFSSSFSGSQQELPFFTEFSFPKIQPSAFPEFPFEPEYPNPGTLPMNPMEETNSKDSPGTQEFSFEPSDSAQIPVQQTKTFEEYPLLNPSFEPAVPGDYMGDATGTMSGGTDVSTGQGASSGSIKPGSGGDETGDQRFESSDGSPTVNNPSNASIPLDSRMPMEGPGNQPETLENSQSKANTEFKNDRTMNPEDSEDIQTSTTVNIVTTTTPYPYTSTSPEVVKLVDTVLDDIYESLRTLNSSSDGDKEPETSYDSSAVMVSTTVPDVPSMDKMAPDETQLTTVASNGDDELRTTQEPAADLEPSFWPPSSPNSNEGSPIGEFRNGTQSSDDAPEDELELRDPSLVFAEHVSSIASSAIALIRSGNANLQELCNKSNDLAEVVDIPPLDVCNEIALVDFLLNVLKTVTFILRSV